MSITLDGMSSGMGGVLEVSTLVCERGGPLACWAVNGKGRGLYLGSKSGYR